MKKTFLLPILMLAALSVQAQNSGFLGKKFMVAAGVQANTNELMFRDDDKIESYDGNQKLKVSSPARYYLDLKSSFYAGYTVSRRLMLGVDVNVNKLSHATFLSYLTNQGGGDYLQENKTAEIALKTRLIGINFKFFQKNAAIAPIGVYAELSAGLINYDLVDEEGLMGSSGRSLASGSGYYIGYGAGRQQMIYKNLCLNIGFDFKLLSTLGEALNEPNQIQYTLQNGDVRVLGLQPAMKTLYSYSFNAKFGLGYMLF